MSLQSHGGRALIVLVSCGFAAGLAGCGGGTEVSKAEYRSELAKISSQADAAHSDVQRTAPTAKTVADVQQVLRRFAAAEDRIGDEVAKLKTPSDAKAANAELARGEHDDADEIRALLPKLAKFDSIPQVYAYLQRVSRTKGGQEEDAALAKLKKLGYTGGS
jgi:hypothetical protein